MGEPKIGAFRWANFQGTERRQAERRDITKMQRDRRCWGDRRFSETAYSYAVGIADRAVENGVSEEDFIKKLIALSEPHKKICRQIYREVKNARLSGE
jgi:hypothetical protein